MSSGKLPYYQRYPRDYIADTMTLTLEEHGAYNLLLDYQWMHGFVPNSPEILGKIWRISPKNARRVFAHIGRFFPKGPDGQHRNDRMEREREKAEQQHLTLSENGRKGAEVKRARRKLGLSPAQAPLEPGISIPDTEAEAEPENNNYELAADAARPGEAPMGLVMQAVRTRLYIPDGKPPKDWAERRCASIAVQKLKTGTPVGEILDAIEGLAILRDRGALSWLKRGQKTTMKALYHTYSGAVPTWTLALNAIHDRPVAPRGKSKPTGISALLGGTS